VYYQDWHRTKGPKPPAPGGLLPGVSRVFSQPPATLSESTSITSTFSSPRNTLSSTTGIVVALNEERRTPTPGPAQQQQQTGPVAPQQNSTLLSFDEEAKLVYGVILSLRTIMKTLSKREEQFTSYRTSTYKLHLYETLSGYKFVMLTDPRADSVRFVLRQLYAGPFLEYVVRNPLVQMNSRERGIDNDYFRAATDRQIRGLSIFQ